MSPAQEGLPALQQGQGRLASLSPLSSLAQAKRTGYGANWKCLQPASYKLRWIYTAMTNHAADDASCCHGPVCGLFCNNTEANHTASNISLTNNIYNVNIGNDDCHYSNDNCDWSAVPRDNNNNNNIFNEKSNKININHNPHLDDLAGATSPRGCSSSPSELYRSCSADRGAHARRLTLRSPSFVPAEEPILTCLGVNSRSIISLENSYSLHKVLLTRRPDIFFLTETWHSSSSPINLKDKNYSTILSPDSSVRGGGVAIIHRHDLLVKPLFLELHQRNLIIARVSSSSSRPVILLCTYVPPDCARRTGALSHLAAVFDFLRRRYSSFSVVGFADLNADLLNRPSCLVSKKTRALLTNCGLTTNAQLSATAT